jgi:hypothetical protein
MAIWQIERKRPELAIRLEMKDLKTRDPEPYARNG